MTCNKLEYNGILFPSVELLVNEILLNPPRTSGGFYKLLTEKIKGTTNEAFTFSTDEAIDKLSKDLIKLVSNSELSKVVKSKVTALIQNNLKEDLLPATVEIETSEENDTPVMEDNEDMKSEEARNAETLETIDTTYYKSAQRIILSRKDLFKADLFRTAILDTTSKKYITDNTDLNIAICNLKNKYYQDIVNYLLKVNPDLSLDSLMYVGDNLTLSENYTKTLSAFYKKLITLEDYDKILMDGWYKNEILAEDTEHTLFYKALNSYVNLVYFDLLIKDAVGKVIVIADKNLKNIDTNCEELKYKFSNGDEHKRKDFRNSENRDALNDIAKYSKLIIELIPFRSNRKPTKRNITLIEFTQAISSLFNYAFKSGDSELREYILKFHSNPALYGELIFRKINNAYKTFSVNTKIPNLYLNILESVAYLVFSKKNDSSIVSIENNALINNFLSIKYSVLECILGVMDRTMNINYYLNMFDPTTNKVITSIKKKYLSRESSYAKIRRINNSVLNRSQEQRSNLFKAYNISLVDPMYYQSYSIKLGKLTLTISKASYDILNAKGVPLFRYSGDQKLFADLLNPNTLPIDLNNSDVISRLINKTDLNESEELFVDILTFIDDYLNLNLLSENGLTLLSKLQESSDSFLRPILTDSFKVAIVDNLYRTFNEQSDITFKEFLRKNYPPIFRNIDKNEKDSRYTLVGGIINLTPILSSSQWLDEISIAEAMLNGTYSKSNTKDFQGNAIANTRTSFLGGNIHYYLNKYREAGPNSATSPLLFVSNSDDYSKATGSLGLIKGYGINLEVSTRQGLKVSVKKLKTSSLAFLSIIHNFYGTYYSNSEELEKTVLILPTTYSDKVSIVTYPISMNLAIEGPEGKSYTGKTLWELNTEEVKELYRDTIGQAYKNLYKAVTEDLKKVLSTLTNTISDRIGKTVTVKKIQLATVLNLNLYLQLVTLDELTSAALRAGVEILLDTHYRTYNGKCRFNELLDYYANDLYNVEELNTKFELEKRNFINELQKRNTVFYLYYYNDPKKLLNNIIKEILEKENVNKTKWTDNDVTLILAKQNGIPLKLGELATGNVELNPILEKYFYLESILANNLRLTLTGSEVAHPNKAKIDYAKLFKENKITEKSHPDLFENGKVSNKVNDLIWLKQKLGKRKAGVYAYIMNGIEVSTQGTLLKRNVIIPATLQYVTLNSIRGVPKKVKVAVIEDIKAPVYNFRGDFTTEDSLDGSAWINPFISLLENKSLQDLEVGWDKKPIWHHYNAKLMTATLLKFATFTMTAERMRTSLNSDFSLYKLFKKMTDISWLNQDGTWNTKDGQEIDLINSTSLSSDGETIDFTADILGNKSLFYEDTTGTNHEILDLGKENGVYYTLERQTAGNTKVSIDNNPIKVFHVFDETGHHRYKETIPEDILVKLNNKSATSINSLFLLYNVLGGIYAKEATSEGSLVYSEIATELVVNYMNLISRESTDENLLTQTNTYLPLKDFMISYAVNLSAVKNGAANINSAKAWTDDSPLKYMRLDTDGLGVQMDADHTIDEAELTEFSLVISALEAGGEEHLRAKLIYKALGKLAEACSSLEIQTVTNYINKKSGANATQVKSDLYDMLGRILINNYSEKEGRADIASFLVKEIKKKYNIHADHQLDDLLLPFSDNSLYNATIANLTSLINSKSIKRKYPGSGCVMVPGYHIILTYKYDNKVLLFDDVLKEARVALKELIPDGDIVTANSLLVNTYLRNKLLEIYKAKPEGENVSEFMPTDKVDIIINNDTENPYTLDLYNLADYYAFKGYTKEDPEGTNLLQNRLNFIRNKFGILEVKNIKYYYNITQAKDLAPARVSWTLEDGTKTNIYDTEEVRNSFLKNENPQTRKVKVRKIFKDLSNNTYKGRPITNLQNEAAELVMSNLYATTFNAYNKSLADVLYGNDLGKVNTTLMVSNYYDFAFTKNNGRHTYITFWKPKGDDVRKIKWTRTKLIKQNNSSELYAVDSSDLPLFKIGRYRVRKDVQYNPDTKKFILLGKDNQEVDGENFLVDDSTGKVLEYLEYVSRYTVITKDKNNHKHTLSLYYINKDNILKSLINSQDLDINRLMGSILSNIWNASPHQTIKLHSKIAPNSALLTKNALLYFNANSRVQKLSQDIINLIDNKGIISDENKQTLKSIYKQDTTNIKDEMKVSFDKTLYYVASRIPALTLQSFMKMKLVGWTLNTKNVAYVSHIQTWLQGSDYKQNCSL